MIVFERTKLMIIQSDEKKKNTDVNLQEILKKTFGFDQFKGEQEAIIRSILSGNDTFVIMPTGGGKKRNRLLPKKFYSIFFRKCFRSYV